MRPYWILAAVILAGAVLGCRSGPGPRGPEVGPLPEPEALLQQLRQRGEARRNLRAMGRVTVFEPDGRVRLRAVLVAERPRSFRFETLTPFEQPVDVMASNGERLWLLREGVLYEGPATSDNVARLLPLPMRPEEVVETFLGGVPVSSRFWPTRVLETSEGRWRLHLEGPEGETGMLLVDPGSLRVLEAELRAADGSLTTEVRFERFRRPEDEGPAVPTDIEVDVPPRALEVRIRLQDPETNVSLPDGLFEMRPPAGQAPQPFPETSLGVSRLTGGTYLSRLRVSPRPR